MPRPPDSATDTYLHVLRSLGVPDAALRRHHDAGPETALRVAVDADLDSPTDDLLAALDATGRVLDLRDGVDPGDDDRLTAAFGRFGYVVECEGTAGDVELLAYDAILGTVERTRSRSDAAAIRSALGGDLLDDAIECRELLDGRLLVADESELTALAERYGPRIEPLDAPLLAPDAAVETADGAEIDSVELDGAGIGGEAVVDEGVAGEGVSGSGSAGIDGIPAAGSDGDLDETLAAADEFTAESIETALSTDGPRTYTADAEAEWGGESDSPSADTTGSAPPIGGGPDRTVSTKGIDDVFDQLESATEDEAAPADDGPGSTAAKGDAVTRTVSESSDPPSVVNAPSTDEDTSDDLAGGTGSGPTRTVSSTSADDILERATGTCDFETIAAEAGVADPDAVLAEADDVPDELAAIEAVDDGGLDDAADALAGTGSNEDASGDAGEAGRPDSAESSATVEDGSIGAADLPPADPTPSSVPANRGPRSGEGSPAGGDPVSPLDSEDRGDDHLLAAVDRRGGTDGRDGADEHAEDESDSGLVGRVGWLFGR